MPVGLSEKFLKVLKSVARDAQGPDFASIGNDILPRLFKLEGTLGAELADDQV